MKKSTIITIIAFVVATILLTVGFILFTENNISKNLFSTETTTTTGSGTTSTTGNAGGNDPEYEAMDFFKEDVSKYVTLGQYKDLSVAVDQLEVSDEYVMQQINLVLFNAAEFTEVKEGVVEEGVVFNFDFKGYINGVPFEGGSGTNKNAYIDGDQFILTTGTPFIDGFAQGVLGARVGEPIEVHTTFPEDYHEADFAGKEAIFKVTVNYIAKTELTDAWVEKSTNGEYKTTAEYVEFVKEYFNDEIATANVNAIWTAIVDHATFIEIPKQEFDFFYNDYREYIEYYAMMMGTNYDNMLKQFGFDDDAALQEYVNNIIKEELVVFAIIQAEQMEASDEEYAAMMKTLVDNTGKTEQEILEQYTEEYIRQQIVLDKVNDFVRENNELVLKDKE